MKIKVNLHVLYAVLQSLSKFIPKRTTIDSYRNVNIRCEDDEMELSVTDGRSVITTKIECESVDYFELSLKMTDLLKILSKNKSSHGTVCIDVFSTAISITLDNNDNPKFKIFVEDCDFPEGDSLEYKPFIETNFFTLLNLLEAGIVSGKNKPGLDNYDRVSFVIDHCGFSVISFNGLSGSRSSVPYKGKNSSFGINLSYVNHLVAQLHNVMQCSQMTSSLDYTIKIGINKKKNLVMFSNNYLSFSIPLETTDVPEFITLFQEWDRMEANSTIEASIKNTKDALDSISFFSEDGNKSIVLEPGEDSIMLNAYSRSRGEAQYEIEALVKKRLDKPFALNSAHFKQSLRTLELPSNLDSIYNLYLDNYNNNVYVLGNVSGIKITHVLSPFV